MGEAKRNFIGTAGWSISAAAQPSFPAERTALERYSAVFDAVEAAALKPLPINEFVLTTWSTGKVGPDCHVKVGRALYSVPWRLMGQRVDARAAGNTVQILHQGSTVATHVPLPTGRMSA